MMNLERRLYSGFDEKTANYKAVFYLASGRVPSSQAAERAAADNQSRPSAEGVNLKANQVHNKRRNSGSCGGMVGNESLRPLVSDFPIKWKQYLEQ